MKTTTAIVILNWNGCHFLKRFLPGVEEYSQLPGVSLFVADNASTDDSLQYLQENHPETGVLMLDQNYGFAEGYNRALQQIEADYYVLLNSDVAVTEGWLAPLIRMMQQKENIAACMPKVCSEASRMSFEYAGAAGGFMDRYGYTFCRGRLFDTVEEDRGQYDSESEIFWATGACCMVRASLFHQAGGFDGQFFAHMEEIDLCWRLKNAGYTIWYTPESTVYHVGGGMLPQSSPFKTYLNYRNNLLMMYKNLPAKQRRKILFTRKALDIVSGLYGLLQGNTAIIRAVWKAHRSYRKMKRSYKGMAFPRIFPSGVYQKSIVYQYFIKKVKHFDLLPPK
ncbi:MAG: glycosyltransferase family 2 protein [Bacteroidales bacterium]|nr:glycosyltransferase family 2 protein [Bacteroidales bacterium]